MMKIIAKRWKFASLSKRKTKNIYQWRSRGFMLHEYSEKFGISDSRIALKNSGYEESINARVVSYNLVVNLKYLKYTHICTTYIGLCIPDGSNANYSFIIWLLTCLVWFICIRLTVVQWCASITWRVAPKRMTAMGTRPCTIFIARVASARCFYILRTSQSSNYPLDSTHVLWSFIWMVNQQTPYGHWPWLYLWLNTSLMNIWLQSTVAYCIYVKVWGFSLALGSQ